MVKPTHIVNPGGDYEENLTRLGEALGKSEIRRQIFNELYGRKNKLRSVSEIANAVGMTMGNQVQQVREQLQYLADHFLIARHDNEGRTNDRSHNVFGKTDFVKAKGNKDKIIRLADDPKKRKETPTKRRPAMQGAGSGRQITKQSLKKKNHLNVLYLTANPDPTSETHLRVDAEYRMVNDEVKRSKYRDNITLHLSPAADLNSLIQGLNDHRPQIVHFSGHGDEGGIETDSGKIGEPSAQLLSFKLLANALKATDRPPEVVVLNSCKSSAAKEKLLPKVKVVIAMRELVSDQVAANFAKNFYAAIASGQSVKAAFEQGKVLVEADWFNETDTPELHCTPGVNPAAIVLT